MVDSVSDSLDESVETIREHLETTIKSLNDTDQKFFKRHNSEIYEINIKTNDVFRSVRRWKKLCVYSLFLELMISVAVIVIAIRI